MKLNTRTILIVDDEPRTRQGIKQTLEVWAAGNYRIETANNGVEALERLQHETIHLLITDVRMPEVTGLDLIRSLSRHVRRPQVVVISGYAEFQYAQQALQFGAVNYLLKPLDKKELIEVVEEALKREEKQQHHVKLEKLVDHKLAELDLDSNLSIGRLVKEALLLLDQHLHENLTMADMASRLHLNSSYFSVLFKEQVGLPFSEYLSRLRIQRAKELLVNTGLSVGEIAEKVGYQTDKYFIKVFKTLEDLSPNRYRQQMKGTFDDIQ